MAYKYAYQKYDDKMMARAFRANLGISLKKSVEVSKYIKGRDINQAIRFLEDVVSLKRAVPYTRYNQEMAHQKGKGVSTGGFPVKVAVEFIKLLKLAQKNAIDKELNSDLVVLEVSARKGSAFYKPGRHNGRKSKRAHVEVIVGVKK